jgi:diphthine-ammonia ligase
LASKPLAAVSWSGGKDSCAALMRARQHLDVAAMITMVDETAARSRSHGLRPEVLDAQAGRLGLRRLTRRCTWPTYNAEYRGVLDQAKAEGITHVVFGDILFPEHREWAERMCAASGLVAVEPLFGSSTDDLLLEWVDSGSEAMIVTTRAAQLDASWLGRVLCRDMVPAFREQSVDPCGENGEYHTVVTHCPLFTAPLRLTPGEVVLRSGCWALDVTVA